MATAVALIVSPICRVHLQWVPFRCGVDSNKGTDAVAKEVAALPQARVPADLRTGPPTARSPERPVAVGDRSSFSVKYAPAPRQPLVRVESQQYLCRIGKNPTEECQQCSDNSRFAGRCIACREEEGTKCRVILRCPAPRRVTGQRLLRLGTILLSPQEDRDFGGRSVHHLLQM